jgi:hypothetical protein
VVAAAALLVVLGVGLGGYLSFRRVNAAREIVVGRELDALVETERLKGASETTARLAREFLMTGDPRTLAASAAHREEVRELLRRARERPDTAELAAWLLAEQDASEARWAALAEARTRSGAGELVERFEREVVPPRRRVDAGIDAIERIRRQTFEVRRAELERASRAAFGGLFAATALGLAFSALLWLASAPSSRTRRSGSPTSRSTAAGSA